MSVTLWLCDSVTLSLCHSVTLRRIFSTDWLNRHYRVNKEIIENRTFASEVGRIYNRMLWTSSIIFIDYSEISYLKYLGFFSKTKTRHNFTRTDHSEDLNNIIIQLWSRIWIPNLSRVQRPTLKLFKNVDIPLGYSSETILKNS